MDTKRQANSKVVQMVLKGKASEENGPQMTEIAAMGSL